MSVHSVFRTFFIRPLRYWFDIWYMNLSWHNMDQVWLWSRLTYFYMSYCPLLKFRFPDFFTVIFWHIEFKFHIWICLDIKQVKFDFGRIWLSFTWVIALCLNFVSALFFVIFRHIEFKFHIWICLDIIQVKFDFGRVWPTFTCPLLKVRFPAFSLSYLDILSWNFIYGFVLT